MFISSYSRVFSCMVDQAMRLKDFSLEEMEAWVQTLGHKAFRGRQLFQWIWQKGVQDFDEMSNISKGFISELKESATLNVGNLMDVQTSSSGTAKFLLGYPDGRHVEAVFIPEEKRVTVCISSQVGCALDCDFCATGKMGLLRNLSSGEILEQMLHVRRYSERPITNIVYMGMGEPFHNYDEVLKSAYILHDELGFGHGARRITISTSGLIPQIRRFAEEGHRFKLAVSLNATTDPVRTTIMPLNKRWPIRELIKACQFYTERSSNMMTFEYVLLKGLNDTIADARRLVKLGQQVFCKVNVIPYNEIGGTYSRPEDSVIEAFLADLSNAKFPITVRWSRGNEIDAACGQLSTLRLSEKEG